MRNPFRRSPKVTLYTTPGCADCAAVKRYLQHKGVAFTEKDVSQNAAWIDEMKRVSGVRIAPVTVVGDEAFYGTFDKQKAGLRRTQKKVDNCDLVNLSSELTFSPCFRRDLFVSSKVGIRF